MASDFLDKLAASVSRTTRGVSDSLRTMSDKSRINKDIAAIEHELRARYQEIGEKYYSANADNPDSEYAEVFASVRELMDALDVRRRDLDALVGSFSCASCGKQLTKGAKFCPYCGVGVPEPAAEEANPSGVCKNCGAAHRSLQMPCSVQPAETVFRMRSSTRSRSHPQNRSSARTAVRRLPRTRCSARSAAPRHPASTEGMPADDR